MSATAGGVAQAGHRRAGNIDCYFGDHRYGGGATCVDCGHFNAPLLSWLRVEKAQREGRHHGDHYHLTAEKAAACPRPTHDAGPCADRGGCMIHDASEAWERANWPETPL
jgi:hypothetical protein